MMDAEATIFCSSAGAVSSAEGSDASSAAARSAVAASSWEDVPAGSSWGSAASDSTASPSVPSAVAASEDASSAVSAGASPEASVASDEPVAASVASTSAGATASTPSSAASAAVGTCPMARAKATARAVRARAGGSAVQGIPCAGSPSDRRREAAAASAARIPIMLGPFSPGPCRGPAGIVAPATRHRWGEIRLDVSRPRTPPDLQRVHSRPSELRLLVQPGTRTPIPPGRRVHGVPTRLRATILASYVRHRNTTRDAADPRAHDYAPHPRAAGTGAFADASGERARHEAGRAGPQRTPRGAGAEPSRFT